MILVRDIILICIFTDEQVKNKIIFSMDAYTEYKFKFYAVILVPLHFVSIISKICFLSLGYFCYLEFYRLMKWKDNL